MNKFNISKRKKYFCMFFIFLYVLSEPVLLCGCASAEDGLVIAVSEDESEDESESGTVPAPPKENMTEVSLLGEEPGMAYIYVCGAVELPGVYCLREGSRIYEAVELAGGLTGDADDTCLNMARQITDGEQVVILTQAEAAERKAAGTYPASGPAADTAAPSASGRVNINTADTAELTTVSGIGESRAQAIIDYREKNGGFHSIEDIKNVEGIKDGLFSKIKDKITI